MDRPLSGKTIAVFVENKFIPEEIEAYRTGFALLGAEVEFVSRIWYGDYRPGHPNWTAPVFHGDVDPIEQQPWETPVALRLADGADVSAVSLDRYAAVIMTANYVSVRLRYPADGDLDGDGCDDPRALVRSAPAVRFFAEAMARPRLVKGALCHGLWILTPNPDLLRGRRVTCHTVVMADILNCGAEVVFETSENGRRVPARVVADRDLVTGFSRHEVLPFVEVIAEQVRRLSDDRLGE